MSISKFDRSLRTVHVVISTNRSILKENIMLSLFLHSSSRVEIKLGLNFKNRAILFSLLKYEFGLKKKRK